MKTSITREQLGKIHDIACKDWKLVLAKYATTNPFSPEIKFTEKQINEMVAACTPEQLPVVKEIFEVRDTWEDIKTVEDAITQLGEVDNEVRQLRLLQNIPNLERKILAGQELAVISKAMNGSWIADFDDHSQYKYYLWWYLGKNFRLSYSNVYCSFSDFPARLCVKSNEIAQYSASQFFNIWKDYMN